MGDETTITENLQANQIILKNKSTDLLLTVDALLLALTGMIKKEYRGKLSDVGLDKLEDLEHQRSKISFDLHDLKKLIVSESVVNKSLGDAIRIMWWKIHEQYLGYISLVSSVTLDERGHIFQLDVGSTVKKFRQSSSLSRGTEKIFKSLLEGDALKAELHARRETDKAIRRSVEQQIYNTIINLGLKLNQLVEPVGISILDK